MGISCCVLDHKIHFTPPKSSLRYHRQLSRVRSSHFLDNASELTQEKCPRRMHRYQNMYQYRSRLESLGITNHMLAPARPLGFWVRNGLSGSRFGTIKMSLSSNSVLQSLTRATIALNFAIAIAFYFDNDEIQLGHVNWNCLCQSSAIILVSGERRKIIYTWDSSS